MHGANPIRSPVKGDGQSLDVQAIFATLQGEGPYAGWPSVFLRLGGCNLACSFCDAEFESFETLALPDILRRMNELARREEGTRIRTLAVITGGEPLRQPIAPLCEALLEAGFKVQIETNGTLFRPLPESVDIICSPKNTGTGYHPLREDLLERITALKFIISSGNPAYNDVAELGQMRFNIPVYVQPMDEGDEALNAANVAYATKLAMERGYRLSLQLHKLVGIE